MRVLCINDNWSQSPACVGRPTPKYMEECVAADTVGFMGFRFYVLSGYDPDSLFTTENFIPLSETNEAELVNEKEEVYA